jgi:hypothetical protein
MIYLSFSVELHILSALLLGKELSVFTGQVGDSALDPVSLRIKSLLVLVTDPPPPPHRLCGLVVRVLGYRSGGPGSIPGTTRKKKVVGLE